MSKLQVRIWLLRLVPIVAIVAATFLLISENKPLNTIEVDLNNRLQVPPLREESTWGRSQNGELRVGMAGIVTPTLTLQNHRELVIFMGHELGRQATLVMRPTYAEVNGLIRRRQVDVSFVCSLSYVEGSDNSSMELLVAPLVNGRTVYYSYLIVPHDSPITSYGDLRQSVFAFTDPLSNSGHLAPVYYLTLLGETPETFFSRYIYTHSHDNSVIAVANGLADGAAVDSLVYDQLAITNPELVSKTRVIARWGPYGIPPVVVNPALDPQLKEQLRNFFLNLHNSATGAKILHSLGIDRFVIVEDNLYDSIRQMRDKMGG